MQQQLQAEAQILDRVMYLLEERSVQRLAASDERFADYIDKLYAKLQSESSNLRQSTLA